MHHFDVCVKYIRTVYQRNYILKINKVKSNQFLTVNYFDEFHIMVSIATQALNNERQFYMHNDLLDDLLTNSFFFCNTIPF